MPKDIAVHVGENGETASLYDEGKIIVYRKRQGQWFFQREMDFFLNKNLGMKELRAKMADALSFLADCKIFVGLTIAGVPYFELEKSHFSIWEFEGKPLEFLDYVLEEEEARQEREINRESNIKTAPVETSDGHYHISLKEIQENNIGVTSKQVLLPFLREGRFYSLEVLCNHVPPWLQAELCSGNFSGEIEKIGNQEIRITIAKNCCHRV